MPALEQEVHQASELFITSTTMEIAPLVELDHRPIGNGKPGKVTKGLYKVFRDMIKAFLEEGNNIL